MVDTSIKNTGNSRSLRTVANALTLYPTHEAMIAAMVNGTFPIDLGPLNEAGINTRGTDLNKGTLFSDAAAANFGLGATGTPDQAFRQLYRAFYGTYTGTGTRGSANSPAVSLTLPFIPKILIVFDLGSGYVGIFSCELIKQDSYDSAGYQVYSTGAFSSPLFVTNRGLRSKRVGNTISWYGVQYDDNDQITYKYILNDIPYYIAGKYLYFGFI